MGGAVEAGEWMLADTGWSLGSETGCLQSAARRSFSVLLTMRERHNA